MKKILTISALLSVFLFGCSDENSSLMKKQDNQMLLLKEGEVSEKVDSASTKQKYKTSKEVIVSQQAYYNEQSDPFDIRKVSITGDFLTIAFYAGGCNGKSWGLNLYDSSIMMKSLPPIRNLKLVLKNKEFCKAYIYKEISFDISKLKLGEHGEVLFYLDGYDKQLSYKY